MDLKLYALSKSYTDKAVSEIGVKGKDGKDGASAYDIAVTHGFEGNEEEWLESLQGTDGVDGVSATHSWNGTTLIITSASGTSSADLKGDKGDPGEQGDPGHSGVYVGSGEIPEGCNVQIDPDGEVAVVVEAPDKAEVGQMLVVKSVDKNGVPTEWECIDVASGGGNGSDGVGIKSIVKTSTSGLVDTYTITFTDESTNTFTITNGADGTDGVDGVGIDTIEQTQISLDDNGENVLKVTLTNGQSALFKVYNGSKGSDGSDGKNGVNGVSPKIVVEKIEGGHGIMVTDYTGTQSFEVMDGAVGPKGEPGKSGPQGIQGPKGETGVAGKDGTDGIDGVSISKTEINSKGELIITLSDNTISNLGVVVGAKGDKGDKGEQGIQGVQGEKGDTGETGKDGQDGKDGASAYDIAVTHGFEGNEEEWLESLQGKDGSNGTDGVDGFSPIANVTQTGSGATISIQDKNGTTTATVKNGKDGEDGKDGYTPVKGVDYFDGKDGKDGSDASVTTENIKMALGYTPAVQEDVDKLSEQIADQFYATQDTATLGDELVTTSGWTLGTGWSGSLANGFTHASGNTEPLTFTSSSFVAGKLYEVSFKSSVAMTTDNLFVAVGNSTQFNLYDEDGGAKGTGIHIGVLSVDSTGLVFTPSSAYTGTITDISVKEITGSYETVQQYFDTNKAVAFEIRVTKSAQKNLYIGKNSGQMNTSGIANVSLGDNTLKTNTSGFWNVAIGKDTLSANTSGSRNIGIGYNALRKNEVGQRNIAIGTFAQTQMKDGSWNVAIGADTMSEATSGDKNVAVGFQALYKNTGDNNVAVGANAMQVNTTGIGNVAVGDQALASIVSGRINVAIGYGAGKSIKTGYGNIAIGANADIGADTYYGLNIGNLLKGSVASGSAYLLINGGLRLPNVGTEASTNNTVYAEEWTFTLEDDSTVTKKVLLV